MKIGEIAEAAQCTVETVRYYEKEGLLPEPGRTASNYRSYGDIHVERLRFIRNCRALDMTQDEIRHLLSLMDRPDGDCSGVNQLLDEHIVHVDARIDELVQLKHGLEALRLRCQSAQPLDECGILHGLTEATPEARDRRDTHLG